MARFIKSILAVVVAGSVAFSSGCGQTLAGRLQEKAAVFQSLDSSEQDLIREGRIESGFTADMVYMALGKPSKIEKSGSVGEIWTYRNQFSAQAGIYAGSGNGEARARDLVVRFEHRRVTSFRFTEA